MDTKRYKVTCLNCGGSNIAHITEYKTNEYIIDLNKDHKENPNGISIISARYRGDMDFGWECRCGNTSLVAREELRDIENLVTSGGGSAIEKITESLKTKDQKKFKVAQA